MYLKIILIIIITSLTLTGQPGTKATIGHVIDQNGLTVIVTFHEPDEHVLIYKWYRNNIFVMSGQTANNIKPELLKNSDIWKVIVTVYNAVEEYHYDVSKTITINLPDSDNDGVPNGPDKYPNDPERAYDEFYPTENLFNTLAFDDRKPKEGDHDMNDLVVYFQFKLVRKSNNRVKDILFNFSLIARGSSGEYRNGFALKIPGVNNIDTDKSKLELDGKNVNLKTHTGGGFIISENTYELLPKTKDYFSYNTLSGDVRNAVSGHLTITLTEAIERSKLKLPFDPYIFIIKDGAEVHLTTKNDKNHPFALEMDGRWRHPLENISILKAYPNLEKWVESNGNDHKDWAKHPATEHIW